MNTLIPGAPLRSLSPTSNEYQRAEGVSRAAKPARVARFTLDAPEHSGTIPGAIGDILTPGVALTSNLAVIFTLNQHMPNSANARISARYTSPLKAFEYMASERPVVASDLPSLGELFEDGRNALLVRPDCPDDLARGIRQILEDPALAQRLSAAGRESVRFRTWDQRAAAILEFVYLRGAPVQRSHWAPVECGATR